MDLGKPNWGDDSMDDIMGNLVLNPGWLFSCAVLFCCFVVVFFFFFASYDHATHSLCSQK